MRCIACALSVLAISHSIWLAAAYDSNRLVRKGAVVSASGEISMVETESAQSLETSATDLLAEVEEMARSASHPEADKIKVIKDIVTGELLPDLKKTRDAAEKQVGVNHKAIVTCNSNSQSSQSSIKSSTEVKVGEARTSHASCRTEEQAKHGVKSKKCQELDDFLNAISVPAEMPNGKPRAQMVDYVKTMSEYYCPKGPTVTDLNNACTHATNQHGTHKAECDRQQAAFEMAFCTWRTQLSDECSELDSCYDAAVKTYNGHVAETKVLVKKWKVEYAALEKIVCYTDVWLNDKNSKTVDSNQLNNCASKTVKTTSMDITYPSVPAKASCDLTPVQNHPGTDAFKTTEYSKFSEEVTTPIPCTGSSKPTVAPKPIEVQYVAEFTKGHVSKDSQQCKDWQSLHQKVDTDAGYITVSVGSEVRTCKDPTVANQILSHFASKDKSRKSYKCGSHTWFVGNCAAGSHLGLEICVDCPKICQCSGKSHQISLRPCINNKNWGGHGHTCGSTKQATLSLTTKAKVEGSMLADPEAEQEAEESDDSWKNTSDPALTE